METIVQEIANVGFTLLVFIIGLVIVNNFKGDKQDMVELTCKKCDDVTIACDEGVVSVTCGLCSMIDLEVVNND